MKINFIIKPYFRRAVFNTSHIRMFSNQTNIEQFGYVFNSEGKLRKLNEDGKPSDIPFQFNVSDNHQECQKKYEELGDAVTEYIYHLLQNEEKLLKLPVPLESSIENGTFIFATEDWENKNELIVLIHGSGVVRAGQWARSLIINDSLNSGSQIPYIRQAVGKGYGVIVLNTNDNYTSNDTKIKSSSSPEEHAIYVWEKYVSKAKANSIAIVAHSYGGVVTLALAKQFKNDFEKRVKSIAFTDSVHAFSNLKISKQLKQVARNWVSSTKPIDAPIETPDFDVVRVSAGHPKHEMTSHSCMESVLKFIDNKFKSK